MSLVLRTLVDVALCLVGELLVPDEVLGAVQTAPVPVCAHDGADEGGVVVSGCGVVDRVAGFDVGGGGGDCCRGGHDGDEGCCELHVGVVLLV